MKKNMLRAATMTLIAALTLTVNSLRAQDTPPPGGPPAGGPPPGQQAPPPNMRQGMRPGMRGRPDIIYRQASSILKRAKMDLERATEDFDGHRQSAIDACDKAIQELDAVQKAIMEAQKAKAAAAAAAAAAQQTNSPAPAPSSTPPPQ
jgi:hypothetical protein